LPDAPRRAAAAFVAATLLAAPAAARTLSVGEGREFAAPSAAAAAARDGDTVEIAPGEYFDCAVWRANGLTIAGNGEGATVTDLACQGKALFVITGRDTTIRNLTFARARVPDGNGGGIRAEGDGLTIEHSRFVNDQSGVLVADDVRGAVRVSDSVFESDGACGQSCVASLAVGGVSQLTVTRTRFEAMRGGAAIRSGALRTEIVDARIVDGETGRSACLIDLPRGGDLTVTGTTLQKGPHSENPGCVIAIGIEGVSNPTRTLLFRDNVLTNAGPVQATFLRNLSDATATVEGLRTQGDVAGERGFSARILAGRARDLAKGLYHNMRHAVHGVLVRIGAMRG
jgi:hypothetical protein